MAQIHVLTYLDQPPHRASTKELKALGMVSRRRTLAKKAEAVNKANPSADAIQVFLDGVQKLSEEQRPVVFLDCLHDEHFPLLSALIDKGLTGLSSQKTKQLLAWGFSHAPFKKETWPFLEEQGAQQDFFKHCFVVPDDLPFSGWQWIGQQYEHCSEPKSIFDKDVNVSYTNFQTVPPGKLDLEEFGRILRSILKAFTPTTSAVELKSQLHNLPRTPKSFVQNPTILMSALLSGWAPEICARLYPHITMAREGIPAQVSLENRFLKMKSAHDWLRLQKEIQNLSEKDKDQAVAIIHLSQGQGTFGGLNAINVHAVLSRHSVTKKLFDL